MTLDVYDHSRDAAGLRYVYPVVSRRSGGVSVGINLNPNNACNYRCVYCQVPGLVAGEAPAIDVPLLRTELRVFLGRVLEGDFMESRVPEHARTVKDVAFSGNGEPTTSPHFEACVDAVLEVLAERGLLGALEVVLITNGTCMGRPSVKRALSRLAAARGVVWYKLDSATAAGTRAVNQHGGSMEARLARLRLAASLCPTKLQTCMFMLDGEPPSASERSAYVTCLRALLEEGTPLRGVLLYGVARASRQPEALRIAPLPRPWLEAFAAELRALGVPVDVSV